jgi:hypothetical protein
MFRKPTVNVRPTATGPVGTPALFLFVFGFSSIAVTSPDLPAVNGGNPSVWIASERIHRRGIEAIIPVVPGGDADLKIVTALGLAFA